MFFKVKNSFDVETTKHVIQRLITEIYPIYKQGNH